MKELVIAAYDKDLTWVDDVNDDVLVSIYRKGSNTSNRIETLIEPNVGRCVHSFFYHIYTNYDKLSDYTFFVQDYPFDHWGNLLSVLNGDVNNIKNLASLPIGGYYGFHNNTLGTAWPLSNSNHFHNGKVLICNSNGHPHDLNPNINVDSYWNILFEGNPPNNYEFIPGGHFAITKEQIIVRPREFYKKVVGLLSNDITAPWLIERLEAYIFDPKYKIKI